MFVAVLCVVLVSRRESWLFDFYCLLGAILLLLLFASSSCAVGWSVVCDSGMSWSYSLVFFCCLLAAKSVFVLVLRYT